MVWVDSVTGGLPAIVLLRSDEKHRENSRFAPWNTCLMFVVINHLKVSEPPSEDVVRDLQDRVLTDAMNIDGIVNIAFIKVDDHHLVMLIVGETQGALDELASTIGSPWVSEFLAPTFTEPPSRVVGEVLAMSTPRS